MKRLLAVTLIGLAAVASGCGSTSCQDACNAAVACANKFTPGQTDITGTNCVNACNASTCSTKQNAIDCINGASCNGTAQQWADAVNACVAANPGCFTP